MFHCINHIAYSYPLLFTNRHYLILLFSFSLGLALFYAIATLLAQLIEPAEYSSDDGEIFGAILMVAGLLNAVIVGLIMDRTRAYRLILKMLLLGACASGIYFVLILQPNQLYPVAVSLGLTEFFLLPLLPISFGCVVECTYPIRAKWSTGLLLCIGNALGGVFICVLGYLTTLPLVLKSNVIITPASIFILCCFVMATLVLMMYKDPYRRLAADRSSVATSSD